jgi:maltose O-acetyltransferase
MQTEKQKMLASEPYRAADPELLEERRRARALCQQLNALETGASCDDGGRLVAQRKEELLAQLFGAATDADITAPFFCDYGYNIKLGAKTYFNFGCVVLDVAPVTIGDCVLFGPGVHIYTALHPMSAAERRLGLESGEPVTIGDDVWVGGGAIICPGVTIGAGVVIGAGSVVTRSIPEGMFAAGNPCRVIRRV